jgi:hypothetical protein
MEFIREYASDVGYLLLMGILAAALIWSMSRGGG